MPTLRIEIQDHIWPTVLAALVSAAGPVPAGVDPKVWASGVTSQWFAAEVAALIEPAPVKPDKKRPRPSRAE